MTCMTRTRYGHVICSDFVGDTTRVQKNTHYKSEIFIQLIFVFVFFSFFFVSFFSYHLIFLIIIVTVVFVYISLLEKEVFSTIWKSFCIHLHSNLSLNNREGHKDTTDLFCIVWFFLKGKKDVLSNLVCILIFFQKVSSQSCSRFFCLLVCFGMLKTVFVRNGCL